LLGAESAARIQQGAEMLFITEYTLHPNLTVADTKRLMDLFGKQGGAPGEIAHYTRIGGGGTVISESDDAAALFAYVLPFSEFMEFNITPALKIEDAVGPILSYLAEN
jgi:hypothetical protein